MKTGFKLLLFLVPALAATLYVLWRFSPEQTVIRHAEVLFTCLEKSTLSTGTASSMSTVSITSSASAGPRARKARAPPRNTSLSALMGRVVAASMQTQRMFTPSMG